MRVINLYGGPCSGKSTTRAKLFGLMKSKGLLVEEAAEFAKDLTYSKAWPMLANQAYVTAGQDLRLDRVNGQVDWCISDSPLPLALLYAQGRFDAEWFRDYVWGLFATYDNVNVFIERVKPYQGYGRSQTEDEARLLDERLKVLMHGRIDFSVPGDKDAHKAIFNHLMNTPV